MTALSAVHVWKKRVLVCASQEAGWGWCCGGGPTFPASLSPSQASCSHHCAPHSHMLSTSWTRQSCFCCFCLPNPPFYLLRTPPLLRYVPHRLPDLLSDGPLSQGDSHTGVRVSALSPSALSAPPCCSVTHNFILTSPLRFPEDLGGPRVQAVHMAG